MHCIVSIHDPCQISGNVAQQSKYWQNDLTPAEAGSKTTVLMELLDH